MVPPRPPRSRHTVRFLLILGAVLVALSIYGEWGRGEGVASAETLAETPPKPPPPPVPAPPDSDAITDRLELPYPSLEVNVSPLGGGELPATSLVVRGPFDREFQAQGSGRWENLPPGPWSIQAEAEGFFPAAKTLTLARGEAPQVDLALKPAALVRGHVTDLFGQPVIGTQGWFLKPAQKHPRLPDQAEGLAMARSDREGRFVSPPLPAGRRLLSCGPVGRVLAAAEQAVELEVGRPRSATIRVRRGSLVEVSWDAGAAPPAKGVRVQLMRVDVRPALSSSTPASRRERLEVAAADRFQEGRPILFPIVPPGTYQLRLGVPGRKRLLSESRFPVGEDQALGVRLGPLPPPEENEEDPRFPITVLDPAPGLPVARVPGVLWK